MTETPGSIWIDREHLPPLDYHMAEEGWSRAHYFAEGCEGCDTIEYIRADLCQQQGVPDNFKWVIDLALTAYPEYISAQQGSDEDAWLALSFESKRCMKALEWLDSQPQEVDDD